MQSSVAEHTYNKDVPILLQKLGRLKQGLAHTLVFNFLSYRLQVWKELEWMSRCST